MVAIVLESKYKQFVIAVCLFVGHILVGSSVSWSAPVIAKLQNPDESPLGDVITETQASWVGSTLSLGGLTGMPVGFLSNVYGRKPCLVVAAVLEAVTHILLTFASNIWMVYIGRILQGLAGGIISIVHLTYIGEIASSEYRGVIFTMTGLFHGLGSLVSYAVGPYVSYRQFGYMFFSMTLCYLAGTIYIPESPLFLLLKGNEKAANAVLNSLGRYEDKQDMTSMVNDVRQKEEKKMEWLEIFTIKSNRKSLFITSFLFIFQYGSGISVLMSFSTMIFADASIDPNIASIIIGATLVIGTTIAPVFVEKFGRKVLMIVSAVGCGVSMVIIGIYFYLQLIEHPSIDSLGLVLLGTSMAAILFYGAGLNIIPNTLVGEMFRSNVRSVGACLAIGSGVLIGFILTTSFGYILVALGNHVTFWIFGASSALAVVFTVLVVPETKGKTLAEIEAHLAK